MRKQMLLTFKQRLEGDLLVRNGMVVVEVEVLVDHGAIDGRRSSESPGRASTQS
jgi:hypothetical protein